MWLIPSLTLEPKTISVPLLLKLIWKGSIWQCCWCVQTQPEPAFQAFICLVFKTELLSFVLLVWCWKLCKHDLIWSDATIYDRGVSGVGEHLMISPLLPSRWPFSHQKTWHVELQHLYGRDLGLIIHTRNCWPGKLVWWAPEVLLIVVKFGSDSCSCGSVLILLGNNYGFYKKTWTATMVLASHCTCFLLLFAYTTVTLILYDRFLVWQSGAKATSISNS